MEDSNTQGPHTRPRWRWPPEKARPLTLLAILLLLILPSYEVSARPYLIFANRRDIRLVEVSPGRSAPKTTIVVKQLEVASAVDFFLQKNKVCWTEMIETELPQGKIKCSEIDPRRKGKVEKETIVETGIIKPEGLACDWVNNKIYWTDSDTDRIEVTSLAPDPLVRRVLFWDGLDLPRAIAVAPNEGVMFWSDWGEVPKIEKASMDGDPSSRVVLVDQDIKWPNGITLDYERKLLYWIEAKHHYIASIDWDGNNRQILFSEKLALQQPFAVSVYLSELYWTDWATNSLNMYNFSSPSTAFVEYPDGSLYHQPERMKFRGKLTPMDIKVFEPMRQKASSSGCSVNNGGCSHLCLASSVPRGYTCSCPTGIKLLNNQTCAASSSQLLLVAKGDELLSISLDTADFTETFIPYDLDGTLMREDANSMAIDYDPVEGTIYWTDQSLGLFRSKLNGSDVRNIIYDEVNEPDGLAVDWIGRNVFWVDNGYDRIEVAKLDGSSRKILISVDLYEPRDIAVDPLHGWIYWSDWGEEPKIEKAWMDGSHREVLVSEDIGWPNGIALDIIQNSQEPQHLYWCDAKTDRIEMINVDGTGRRVIIDQFAQHPFGLSVLGEYIYWTDWDRRTVERANKLTGEDIHVLLNNKDRLMSVQTVDTKPNPKWNNACSSNNGGCSHLCLFTPKGRVCECPNGYEITEANGVKCVVPEAFLLYTRKTDIVRVSLMTPNHNGYVLPIKSITAASAIDFDKDDSRIYWTDNEEKTISRSFVNGSSKEVIIEFGLDFPDGMAIDWVSKNIYWTDTGLNRIEVARSDGSSRRVLLWKDLKNPASIAVDPAAGIMYWSTWSDVPVIEYANMDGSGRASFMTGVGKTNGLTIDYDTHRLYWTDLYKQSVSYSLLASDKPTTFKTVYQSPSPQLYSLSLYKDHVYWIDWEKRSIERANKENGSDHSSIQSDLDDIMDVMVFHESRQVGSNPCSVNNGGCPHLCLYVGGQVQCTCPSHYFPAKGNASLCIEPDEFLLFSQKNKMSRLLVDDLHPNEVPDLVLPIFGSRDIQSISYDPTDRVVYWIDHGSKKKEKHQVSIKRAQDNGTHHDRLVKGSSYRPYDLAIDSYSRLLYWSCEQTNAINVTRIDALEEDESVIGSIINGNEDRPRSIAVHPFLSLIFWVNIANPIRIERARVDGSERRTIAETSLGEQSDLATDIKDDLLFWADITFKRIESSGLNGENRKTVISIDIQGPVLIAIQGRFLYWGDRGQQSIYRANKITGRDKEVVKSKAPHLSAIISVRPKPPLDNPCLRADCSHLCIVDLRKGQAKCSCPQGSGLVLNADEQTCGLPPTCKPSEFTCTTGTPACIPLQWRCDGQLECSDHSDEIGCPECAPKQFKCRNNGCVNGTLICDGIKHCDDGSDEVNCCPKEKFTCTSLSGGCVDQNKTCDGVKDCSDGSDEDQCPNGVLDGISNSASTDGSNPAIPIVIGVIAGIVVVGLILFVFCFVKKNNSSDNESSNPLSPAADIPGIANGTLQRGPAAGAENKHTRHSANGLVLTNNNSAIPEHDVVSRSLVLSTASGHGNIGGSSNGIAYDRSHVTGASSSTTSSSNYPREFSNPPPSPATTVANRVVGHSLPPRQHQSMHSLPRTRHRDRAMFRQYPGRSNHHGYHPPPPPTPYSTDFNEESDGYGGSISRPHFTSAANSTHGGYESSDVYAEHVPYNQHPPPPTPQYYSDYGNDLETSNPPSPTPEDAPFFLTQPPPSPVPSISQQDDFEDEDEDDSHVQDLHMYK